MKVLKLLLPMILLASTLLPIPSLAADEPSVHFERVAESPVSVTFLVAVTNIDEQTADIKFVDLGFDINSIKIDTVTYRTERVQQEIIGERDTTVADYLSSKKDMDESGNLSVLSVADSAISSKYSPETKVRDVQEIKDFPLTTLDVVGYETVDVLRTDKVLVDKLDYDTEKQFVVSAKDTTAYYEITVNTAPSANRDGWGSKGLLMLVINGIIYFDNTHSSWWDNSWSHRTQITFDNTASTDNLIDFPVLVTLSEPTIEYDEFQADGGDIRFIDADGLTELDYEIDTWDAAGTSYIWVEVPQIDDASNTDYITMYWDNPTVANGWNIAGTWNAGYAAVYHMNDATTSTITDSKGVNNGTKTAANEPVVANGYIGKAQDFDGLNDLIACGNNVSLRIAGVISIEVLHTPDAVATGTAQTIVKKIGNHTGYYLDLNDWNPYMGAFLDGVDWGSYATAGFVPVVGTRYYMSYTYDATTHRIYRDNNAPTSRVDTGGVTDALNSLYLGGMAGTYSDGLLDEVRISNVVRSSEWIEATYLTMTSAGFVTFGGAGTLTAVTNPATAIGAKLATLNGAATDIGNFHIATRGFEYDTDSGAPYASDWHEDGDFVLGSFETILDLPDTGNTYYYRSYVTDMNGVTAYGAEQTFTAEKLPNFLLGGGSVPGGLIRLVVAALALVMAFIVGKGGMIPAFIGIIIAVVIFMGIDMVLKLGGM